MMAASGTRRVRAIRERGTPRATDPVTVGIVMPATRPAA